MKHATIIIIKCKSYQESVHPKCLLMSSSVISRNLSHPLLMPKASGYFPSIWHDMEEPKYINMESFRSVYTYRYPRVIKPWDYTLCMSLFKTLWLCLTHQTMDCASLKLCMIWTPSKSNPELFVYSLQAWISALAVRNLGGLLRLFICCERNPTTSKTLTRIVLGYTKIRLCECMLVKTSFKTWTVEIC